MKMILTGSRINAKRAHELGIVQEIYPCMKTLHEGQLKLAEKVA